MGDFLVRKFVNNYEDTNMLEVRTQYGVLSSIVGILCNVLLFVVKFASGVMMHSIAVMADAFNNLSDAASSVVGFVGVKMASKPADKEHPFGHGRVEYIAAFIVAFLVIEVGFSLFKTSIGKIRNPEEIVFELIPFCVLVISIGVKLWMALFNKKYGKRIDSKVMLATSADSLGDVITTSATLVSILISHFTGYNIDGIAGLLISVVVMWSGVGIAKETLEPLIGQAADPVLYQQVTDMVESYDGIWGTHDLIIHNYGPNRSMASIHAEVPRSMDIETSHEIIDKIEHEVAKQLGLFLVIHIDPVEVWDKKTLKARADVTRVLRELDEELTMHDFHMVNEKGSVKLIFDMVVPYTYDEEKVETLKNDVCAKLSLLNSKYRCEITVDRSFVNQE